LKPYYQDNYVTIYHGDCREILPTLPDNSVDLVLTDPPYGLGIDGSNESIQGGVQIRKRYEFMGWDKAIPDAALIRMVLAKGIHHIIFGANYFNEYLEQGHKGWVIWDKGQRDLTMSDCEIIYTDYDRPARIITEHRAKLWAEKPQHPTQKPVELVSKLIQGYSAITDLILDPFLGSGTTAYCAKKLNRKCIGIEIEEKYCEIAANRCRQSVMELRV
jgi:site-specific DNA-methyltransferase (adenine-specific)